VSYEVIVEPEAEADIIQAAVWYEQQASGLGFDFNRIVDACLADISRNPKRFPVVHAKAHRALLRRFPFGVFFLIDGQAVHVIACLHVRRDPDRWQRRLRNDR
jgi:plasmid stabilization system protein ParE